MAPARAVMLSPHMPIRFQLRDDVLSFVTVGDVDYEAGLGVLEQGIEEARRAVADRRWDVVFDIRESAENRSKDELVGVAAFVASHPDVLSGRCAVVASDPFHFGLARMFSAHAESLGIEALVTRDVRAALDWLAARTAMDQRAGDP